MAAVFLDCCYVDKLGRFAPLGTSQIVITTQLDTENTTVLDSYIQVYMFTNISDMYIKYATYTNIAKCI